MEPLEPVKFLLADDIDENLRALEALLRRDGLVMFKARSGVEALELMLEHDFALALLDVQMPGMDGFELAELMRGTERTRRIPIIFVTAAATDEGRRFRGYETGAVDFIYKPVDPLILKSKAQVFFDIARQHQQLARQKDELARAATQLQGALDRLKAHTDNSPLAIVEFDPDMRVRDWSKGAERLFGWSAGEMVGHRLDALGWLPDACAEALMALFASSMADAAHQRGHNMVGCRTRAGAMLDCEWYSSVLRDGEGRPLSLSVQILDVTERRQAEETQRLLIGELNHRVKNTLASVQAIATQTLRYTRSPEQFSATFSGRIQALARAHGMLSDSTWQGADLMDLVQDQLQLGAVDPQRLSASGPQVQLRPQTALRLALILHELSTNAIKYGAFSGPTGRVALTWSVAAERLQIRWQETGGPPVKAPVKRGFGSMLIENSVKPDGGSAAVSYGGDGVLWDFLLPLGGEEDSAPSRPAPRQEARRVEPAAPKSALEGRAILVVEDEPLVALELISILEDAGAKVLGPVGAVADALHAIDAEAVEAVFLDGNLQGEPVDDVAAALTRKNIPFSFVSGYGRENLPPAFAQAPVIGKPFTPRQLLDAAARMLGTDPKVVALRPAARANAPR
ncbi:response regulator [Starkeya koreensis]|uniref:Blue-light-activated histidine kinase n=1 Tax=Ancylobacter koreensis TaxID=266121 RepID=A0ABT0DKH7_9HYPH|nr:response regulator [Ancylobacter koreensis]MCK0207780.1 response regulator [Ancylobacter koreensis]